MGWCHKHDCIETECMTLDHKERLSVRLVMEHNQGDFIVRAMYDGQIIGYSEDTDREHAIEKCKYRATKRIIKSRGDEVLTGFVIDFVLYDIYASLRLPDVVDETDDEEEDDEEDGSLDDIICP